MVLEKRKLEGRKIPKKLRLIASPPQALYVTGPFEELTKRTMLAVVGTRKMTAYGKAVTEKLISKVTSRGVVIVSGLALGVDACAHKAALDAGGQPLAILPTDLDNIAPKTNLWLARQIVAEGGALMSEHGTNTTIRRSNFVIRNRLVSGIADAVLIIESTEKGGTMHTAEYAQKQGKPLLVVPGPITSPQSRGPNSLLNGAAIPVTEATDILRILGINSKIEQTQLFVASAEEKIILKLINDGLTDGHELQQRSKLAAETFSQTMTLLEIAGHIKSLGNNQWSL